MPDFVHVLLRYLDHNRYLAAGLALAILMLVYTAGCQPRTASLLDPQQDVTLGQFAAEIDQHTLTLDQKRASLDQAVTAYNAEIDHFNQSAQRGYADIQEQQAFRMQIIDTLGGVAMQAAEGTIHPASLITSLFSLASLAAAAGLGVDNVRKDRVIKKMKVGGEMIE